MYLRSALLFSLLPVFFLFASAYGGTVEEAEEMLKLKKFPEAIAILTNDTLANAGSPDYATYLRAVAGFQNGQFVQSQADCEKVPANSPWHHKAVFLKAANLVAQKKHGEAESIYRLEAERLFAVERKEKLARLLIEFANELREDGDSMGGEQARKALALIGKSLELNTGKALREKSMFDKITVLRDQPDSLSAIEKAAHQYLAEFDPDWKGPVGEVTDPGPKRQEEIEPGKHLWDVRMILLETMAVQPSQQNAMRRYARGLLETAPEPGDVAWLIAKSYDPKGRLREAQVSTGRTREPFLRHLRSFLEDYSDHGRSAESAIAIARELEGDEAIRAYQSFLGRGDWPPPATNRGDKTDPGVVLDRWREQASFQIGQILFDRGDYPAAIKQWEQYSRDFANGSLWKKAESSMVTAEFRAALDPVASNNEPEARKRFEAFMKKHPLDARVPQLLFLLGEFPFSRAGQLEGEMKPANEIKPLFENAVSAWSRVIAKYPDSYEAKLALYRTGTIQTGPLQQFEAGLATLEKVAGKSPSQVDGGLFPNSNEAARILSQTIEQNQDMDASCSLLESLACKRIELLKNKSLSLSTERVYHTNETPRARLAVRNIEEVTVSRYRLDLEKFFRSHHRFDTERGIEGLDIDLIQPDETWKLKIDGFTKFKAMVQEVEIPFPGDEPGVSIVRVEGDGWQASTVVLRSNIDLITECTWREALVFARDSVTMTRIPGAQVLVTNGKELIGQGRTDVNGIFRLKGQMIREAADLCFYVGAEQGEAMKRLPIVGMTQQITGGHTDDNYATLSKKGYLYTGKDRYYHDETVHLRGILREVKDGNYIATPGEKTTVKLLAPNGDTAREWKVPLGPFGTFHLSFALPSRGEGRFVIQAKQDQANADIYATAFQLRNRPEDHENKVKIELVSKSVLPGETIRGKVIVQRPWGEPVARQLLHLEFPDGRREPFQTDQNGEAAFTQETGDLEPGEFQRFHAKLIHLSGSGSSSALIQPAAFRFGWKDWPETTLAGEPLKFSLEVSDEAGEPLAQKLQFEIEKLPDSPVRSVLSGLPSISGGPRNGKVIPILKREVISAPETGRAELEIAVPDPGKYRIIVSGTDQGGNQVRQLRTLEVGGGEDDSRLRIFSDKAEVKEGEVLRLNVHSGVASSLVLVTLAGADVLENRVIALQKGATPLEIPIRGEHWPRFDVAVACLHDGKLERARRSFVVERFLNIKIEAPGGDLIPGAGSEFSIITTDSSGKPVAAEVNLGLSGNLSDHIHSYQEMFRKGQRPGSSFRIGSTAVFEHNAKSRFLAADGSGDESPASAQNHEQNLESILKLEENLRAPVSLKTASPGELNGARIMSPDFQNYSPSYRWSGPVVTGPNGRATIRMMLPDTSGDWRMSAIGCDEGRLFGETNLTIRTDRALNLTQRPPLGLRVGDQWNPEVWLELDSGEKARSVNLTSRVGDAISARTVEAKPGRPQRILFDPRTATEKSSWAIELDGKKWSETVVSVGPRGVVREEYSDRTPGNRIPPEVLLGNVGLSKIVQTPGIEHEPQTEASALLAATSALRFARSKKLDSPELEARIRKLILTLQVTQSDGGWSWRGVAWGRDSLTTALGLWGLREAKNLGFHVDESMIKTGIKFLGEVLAIVPPEEPEKSAMILFALALEDSENFSIANRLYRERNELNPAALSFLAGTFLRMERNAEAGQILEALLARTETNSWPGSELVARLSQSGDITAVALWSLAKTKSPEAQRVADWLLRQGGANFGAQSALRGLWTAAITEHFFNNPDKAPLLFVPEVVEENTGISELLPEIVSRKYYPAENLRHGDGYLNSHSTSPLGTAELGQVIRVETQFKKPAKSYRSYIQIDEPIPAGCILKPGSLKADHAKFEQIGSVLRITGLPGWDDEVKYELVALHPGVFHVPPPVIRDNCRPSRYRMGNPASLTILPAGQKTPDNYQINAAERFELAKNFFDEDEYEKALTHLEALETNHTGDPGLRRHEREISRMLLWIHADRPETAPKQIVKRFEALSERHSDVVIPFDKILKVAQAYKSLGELERAWLVYRAMIESNFIDDATVAAALKQQGDLQGYAETQIDLWYQYPDARDVLLAYQALAQELEERSANLDDLVPRKKRAKPTREDLLKQSRDHLDRYLTLYAGDELSDVTSFRLANIYFDLKDYGKVASRAETAAQVYPESRFHSSFQYMAALGHFWQYEFPQSLRAAEPVANGRSENAPNARYIIAQVYHAQGNPVEAIKWYQKVKDDFEDAGESLEYLEEKGVKLPAASTFRPGQDVKIELSYRNIREADLQVYKVDLMRLYSRQKGLANIAKVSLAGISPQAELSVPLGDGKDYEWRKRELSLPLKGEGAYLLVCRGDSTFASGLILVSPLELKVRESPGEGNLRLHLWDSMKKAYVADARVKAFDSLGTQIQQGRTDPRGAFQAADIEGFATVIVKHAESNYAYYRSNEPLSPLRRPVSSEGDGRGRSVIVVPIQNSPKPKSNEKDIYFRGLKSQLKKGSAEQKAIWSEKLEKGGKGVEASKAFKR